MISLLKSIFASILAILILWKMLWDCDLVKSPRELIQLIKGRICEQKKRN